MQGLRSQTLITRVDEVWQGTLEALADRVVLFLNHLLSSEPEARARLRAHVGRQIQVRVSGLPLPAASQDGVLLAVTPAALFEKLTPGEAASDAAQRFGVHVDARAAMDALLSGGAPTQAVRLDGDAALATDLAWLIDHLRWDIEGDLASILPPAVAHGVVTVGRTVAAPLARLAGGLRSMLSPGR